MTRLAVTGNHASEQAMAELDGDGSGSVSKQEFESWYHEKLTSMTRSPLDVLFATTRQEVGSVTMTSLVAPHSLNSVNSGY